MLFSYSKEYFTAKELIRNFNFSTGYKKIIKLLKKFRTSLKGNLISTFNKLKKIVIIESIFSACQQYSLNDSFLAYARSGDESINVAPITGGTNAQPSEFPWMVKLINVFKSLKISFSIGILSLSIGCSWLPSLQR